MRERLFGHKRLRLLGIAGGFLLVMLGLSGWLSPIFNLAKDKSDVLQEVSSGLIAQLPYRKKQPVVVDPVPAEVLRLKRENAILRSELGLTPLPELKTVRAEVIGRNIHALRRIITINIGTDDGIKAGTEVFSKGYLVGVVEQARDRSSDVILLNDPLFRTTVMIGTDNAEGILIGETNGVFIDKVPITSRIKTDEPVFSSGLDGYIRRGLPIGFVSEVETQKDEVFYSVIVRVPVTLDNLELVEVAR